MSLNLRLQPESPALTLRNESQLCYVLVTIDTRGSSGVQRSVNWALIADASHSMRIPIVNDEQFRQLARAGHAEEVVVDGVPVWKFTRPVPDEIKNVAPDALSYVQGALHSVVEWLNHADRFALVACAEDAVVLVPGHDGMDRSVLATGINKLKDINLGSETNLARGLRLGWMELERGRGSGETLVERLLLLTDGFTQQPSECLNLARQIADEGISISTMGLGGDFQEDLLTTIADISGGRAIFLQSPDVIPIAVEQELTSARAVAMRALTLKISRAKGVIVRRVTRVSPTLVHLKPIQITRKITTLHLGDLEQHRPIRLLLEVVVPPAPSPPQSAAKHIHLAKLYLNGTIGRHQHEAMIDLVGNYWLEQPPMQPEVVDAAARANAGFLQRQALNAYMRGDQSRAASLLRQVAARLTTLGETHLAEIAHREAESLEHTGQTTRLGTKELAYATRRLGMIETRL